MFLKEVKMRHTFLALLFFSLAACASQADLRPVIHQGRDLLVVLDKEEVQDFPVPYEHPINISPKRLQWVLEALRIQPQPGFLKSLFAGESEKRPLFDAEKATLMSRSLSQALARAKPSEHIVFYDTQPKPNKANINLITSGFFLLKGGRLHLHLEHYRVPLRKGRSLSRVGRGLSIADKSKFTFALMKGDHIRQRHFKGVLGLEQTDPHWLMIDYAAFSSAMINNSSSSLSLPESRKSNLKQPSLEEKLRTLKHLWEEKLISEEEYIEKRKAVLEDF